VLYFDNLSPDTADAYLADGLTEELIARLGQLQRLAVKSRAAVQRFRQSGADPLAAARALRVARFVTGSVRRAGSRLRVTVELVRAADGEHVWGDLYDRRDADLLAVEEEITRAVAAAIGGRLQPGERAALAARPTASPEAYDHFLRGNFELAQRTPRSVGRAIEEYERALRLDPGLTQALARIAYSHAVFVDWGWSYPGVSPESLVARGLAAAEDAVRKAPRASDAWMALGLLRFHSRPRTLAGVDQAFREAITLDPRNAEALHQYGSVLTGLGRDSAAIAVWRQALELEPDRVVTLFQVGMLRFRERQYPDALRWLDSALVLEPGFLFAYALRARARLFSGDIAGARADAETALRLGSDTPPWGEFAIALVEAHTGDTAAARARVERLDRAIVNRERPTAQELWHVGAALVSIGEQARALDL